MPNRPKNESKFKRKQVLTGVLKFENFPGIRGDHLGSTSYPGFLFSHSDRCFSDGALGPDNYVVNSLLGSILCEFKKLTLLPDILLTTGTLSSKELAMDEGSSRDGVGAVSCLGRRPLRLPSGSSNNSVYQKDG